METNYLKNWYITQREDKVVISHGQNRVRRKVGGGVVKKIIIDGSEIEFVGTGNEVD